MDGIMNKIDANVELIWQQIEMKVEDTADNLQELPKLFIRVYGAQQWSLPEWQARCAKVQLGRLPRKVRDLWSPQLEAAMSTGFAAAAMGVTRQTAQVDKNPSRDRKMQDILQNPTDPVDNTDDQPENDDDYVLPMLPQPAKTIQGVRFPPGGISDTSDVTRYNTSQLAAVASELIRRATPDELNALSELFTVYADKARKGRQ